MKTLSTILTAAFIAGSCTFALAQGAGGDVNPNSGVQRGADKNPTGAANPAAGNPGGAPAANMGSNSGGMTTAPVSGTPRGNSAPANSASGAQGQETGTAKDSAGPAGERGVPGSGGSK